MDRQARGPGRMERVDAGGNESPRAEEPAGTGVGRLWSRSPGITNLPTMCAVNAVLLSESC